MMSFHVSLVPGVPIIQTGTSVVHNSTLVVGPQVPLQLVMLIPAPLTTSGPTSHTGATRWITQGDREAGPPAGGWVTYRDW